MTLQDALDRHASDRDWLTRHRGICWEDWDTTIEVTHTAGPDWDLYLGDDGETVFVVHGQAEPQLTCDGALWHVWQHDAAWWTDGTTDATTGDVSAPTKGEETHNADESDPS